MIVKAIVPPSYTGRCPCRRLLTHGPLQLTTQRGRQASSWSGALAEIARRLSSSCQNLTNRDGRFDLTLPSFVVNALRLNEKMEPILAKLRTIMGRRTAHIRTHNVVFAPVGSDCQPWHFDVTTITLHAACCMLLAACCLLRELWL
jgi:hypothetical protein